MTRNRLAAFLAVAALAGVLGLGIAHDREKQPAVDGPQGAVYSMLAAARIGNVSLYLDHFVSPAVDALRQTIRDEGGIAFSNSLRESNVSLEGIAVADPEWLGDGAQLRVEYVYRERTVVQHFLLRKAGARWKIYNVASENSVRMPTPFGTPVR